MATPVIGRNRIWLALFLAVNFILISLVLYGLHDHKGEDGNDCLICSLNQHFPAATSPSLTAIVIPSRFSPYLGSQITSGPMSLCAFTLIRAPPDLPSR